jgi:tetratricopeptide (TPR) repeat protein
MRTPIITSELPSIVTELEAALKLDPDNPEKYNDFGVAHKGKGLIDKAIELYKMALRLKPDYAIAHMNLGVAYDLKGLRDKANEHFNRAHDLEPDKY